jgi:multisubunit Na+/H+ antiporter MnhC subunit
VIALLLDLANIVGGFLLAAGLFRRSPRIGADLARAAARIAPFGWIVGVVALVTGGYYLILHATSGPHVFHFELVGIGVGVALLWDRLTGRTPPRLDERAGDAGAALLLAIFGIIAIIVGVQGLLTPN